MYITQLMASKFCYVFSSFDIFIAPERIPIIQFLLFTNSIWVDSFLELLKFICVNYFDRISLIFPQFYICCTRKNTYCYLISPSYFNILVWLIPFWQSSSFCLELFWVEFSSLFLKSNFLPSPETFLSPYF